MNKLNQTIHTFIKLLLVLIGATFLLALVVRLLPGSPADFYTNALDEETRQLQIKDLVSQLNKWIELDMQKAEQQQEVMALMKAQREGSKN